VWDTLITSNVWTSEDEIRDDTLIHNPTVTLGIKFKQLPRAEGF
jgi:hypothetical protein